MNKPTSDNSNATDQAMRKLLKTVGPRVEPDPERTERVRQSVQNAWRESIPSKSYIKPFWASGIAATFAMVIFGNDIWQQIVTPDVAPPIAKTEIVRGTVDTVVNSETIRLAVDSDLLPGSIINTSPDAGITLDLAGTHQVRVDENTSLELLSATELSLTRGRIYIDSADNPGDPAIFVRTPFGSATDVGTQFSVALDSMAVSVSVREGLVDLMSTTSDQVLRASLGQQLTVNQAGEFVSKDIPIFGDRWSWISPLTPMFEPEGKTLADFLEWICANNGWTLQFSSPLVAQSARIEPLAGSQLPEGIPPQDALETVLSTTKFPFGFRFLENGVLMVESKDAR